MGVIVRTCVMVVFFSSAETRVPGEKVFIDYVKHHLGDCHSVNTVYETC